MMYFSFHPISRKWGQNAQQNKEAWMEGDHSIKLLTTKPLPFNFSNVGFDPNMPRSS